MLPQSGREVFETNDDVRMGISDMNIKQNNLLRILTGNRINKIRISFLVILMTVMMLFCPIVATTAYAAKDEVETIRVGFFHFDGYHDISDQGVRSGYGYQFLRLLSRYTNLNFEYVGYDKSWDEMQKMLENGEIDMVTSMHYTADRVQQFGFSTYIGFSNTIMTVRNDNTTIKLENYADFDGMKVGFLANSSRNEKFRTYAEDHDFQYKPVYFEDQEEMTDALKNGEVDAIVTSNLRKLGQERIIEEFDTSKFYAVVKKENKELLSKINYGISQMDIYEGDWRSRLHHNNYDVEPLSEIIYSENEQSYLDAHQKNGEKLRVYFIPNSQPYCFIKDGEVTGIIPDIVRRLMDETGLNYEFVTTNNPQDYKRIFEEGKADIVPAMVGTESYAESKGYLMTDAYLTNYVCRVFPRRANYNTGKIAVPATAIYQKYLSAEGKTIVLYPTVGDAVEAVKAKEVDSAYVEYYSCQWLLSQDQSQSLSYELEQNISYGMQIAVNQRLPHELCSIMNKNLKRLTNVELRSIIQQYMGTSVEDLSLGEYIWANLKEFLLYAGIAVAVILLIVTSVLAYMNRIKHVNAEMQRVNEELREALDNYKQADYDRRTDFLTGLHNRQDMFEMFQDALSGKRQAITALFMMDIDDFKRLNDRYGHIYGDECLKRIGAALKTYGAENNMLFYRYGGEEMLGISYSEEKQASQIAEELVQLVRDQRILRDDTPSGVTTVSLGYTTNNRRYEKMIDMADTAMYRAKENGKDQAVCYDTMEK